MTHLYQPVALPWQDCAAINSIIYEYDDPNTEYEWDPNVCLLCHSDENENIGNYDDEEYYNEKGKIIKKELMCRVTA